MVEEEYVKVPKNFFRTDLVKLYNHMARPMLSPSRLLTLFADNARASFPHLHFALSNSRLSGARIDAYSLTTACIRA